MCRVAGVYKLTIPQSPPSHLRDYSLFNNARFEFSTIFVTSFDPNEWCLKNGLHSGGLHPGPLGHESFALTTRPRLIALALVYYRQPVVLADFKTIPIEAVTGQILGEDGSGVLGEETTCQLC
jgi:hypothetical protein